MLDTPVHEVERERWGDGPAAIRRGASRSPSPVAESHRLSRSCGSRPAPA